MALHTSTRIVNDSGTTLGVLANPLVTTASITGDINADINSLDTTGLIGKPSGGDFTTAYLAGTTITLGVLPDGSSLTNDDIVSVTQIATTGAVTATYTRDDVTMTIAANVLTITGATFVATDSFVIYTNVPRFIGGAGAVTTQVQRVTHASDDPVVVSLQKLDGTSMQTMGTEDVAGADTYTTIITSAGAATHALLSLGGANDAIISFNGGTTDHFVMKANSIVVLDGIDIAATTAVQGKNKTSGSNYANLNISIW